MRAVLFIKVVMWRVVVAPEELLGHTAAATGLLELLWRVLGPTGSNKKCRTVMLP